MLRIEVRDKGCCHSQHESRTRIWSEVVPGAAASGGPPQMKQQMKLTALRVNSQQKRC